MNCPICGKQINENDTYCKNCGSPLTAKQRAYSTLPQTKKIRMLKISDYLLMFALSIIPLVNLISFVTWCCSSKTNINKKNYAAAALIFSAFVIVLCVIIFFIFKLIYPLCPLF